MTHPRSIEWLKGKTLEDLAPIVADGRLLFPDSILRATPKGFEEVAVRVRVPRMTENIEARKEAISIFDKAKLDRERKDAALFEELETICKLSRAIREHDAPHAQKYSTDELLDRGAKGFDTRSLYDLWDRLSHYEKLIDPRITTVSLEAVTVAALSVAATGNLTPLAGFAGDELDKVILTMAQLVAGYVREKQQEAERPAPTPSPDPEPEPASAETTSDG